MSFNPCADCGGPLALFPLFLIAVLWCIPLVVRHVRNRPGISPNIAASLLPLQWVFLVFALVASVQKACSAW
jgi:hypothetical protein